MPMVARFVCRGQRCSCLFSFTYLLFCSFLMMFIRLLFGRFTSECKESRQQPNPEHLRLVPMNIVTMDQSKKLMVTGVRLSCVSYFFLQRKNFHGILHLFVPSRNFTEHCHSRDVQFRTIKQRPQKAMKLVVTTA